MLTDEFLDELEADAARRGLWTPEWRKDFVAAHEARESMLRGFAEAREKQREEREELARLRSDEWLEKAAGEIARQVIQTPELVAGMSAAILAVLRKHRDGKA